MKIFQLLQVIIFSYVGISICMAIFIWYFIAKYGSHRAKKEMNGTLEKLRGRKTILLPFQVLSYIFLFSWLSLVLPFVDFTLHIGFLSSYENNTFTTWVGSFSGKQGDMYFLTTFIGVLGAKGSFVISYISSVLSDKTLAVKQGGRIGYNQEL